MAKQENLKERMDTVKANSVSDREFEETWGISIDAQVDKMMARWDTLLAQAREAIDNDHQPADERQQPAAEAPADSAERKEESFFIYYVATCPNDECKTNPTKAEKAKLMHQLYIQITELLNEFVIESKSKKSEKENNEIIGLVMLNLKGIIIPEEKNEIRQRLDTATFKGVKLKRTDVMPEGDYERLELSINAKKEQPLCKKAKDPKGRSK